MSLGGGPNIGGIDWIEAYVKSPFDDCDNVDRETFEEMYGLAPVAPPTETVKLQVEDVEGFLKCTPGAKIVDMKHYAETLKLYHQLLEITPMEDHLGWLAVAQEAICVMVEFMLYESLEKVNAEYPIKQ